MIKYSIGFASLFIFLTLPLHVFSYEVNVHEKITREAVISGGLARYLNTNLNISLDAKVNGKYVSEWLELGSNWEDDDITMRWLNHFYDPTTGKGLNSAGIIKYGEPSLQWGKISLNSWDWESARAYYYSAITSNSEGTRNLKFADLFRSLGQIIHLIQDKAVPAHVRNDAHAPSIEQRDLYEKYTRDAVNRVGQIEPLRYAGYPAVEIATFNIMDAFWINNGKGLSEFTNRNFLSRDTNIDDEKYPLPVPIGEWIARETVHDFGGHYIDVDVKYLNGYVTDDYRPDKSTPIQRLSAISYFDYEMQKLNGQRVYSLNNFVHNDYAAMLLPRAVGYSAGLLDYFFRGNIEITLSPSDIYGFTGSREAGFTRITLDAKNTTANNEEMTDGTIELIARYRTVQGDPFQPFDLQASNDYVYIVVPEATGRRSIPMHSSVELVFDRGQTAIIPANAVDISLQIVYHGRLGNEEGAVAVGMKGISDPTPVERMNNMDKACLNGQWYNAGSPEAIAQVDSNHNGIPEWDIYPHNLKDVYVKISAGGNPVSASASQYTYSVGSINAGHLSRAFILADTQVLQHSHFITVEKTTIADTFTHADNAFNGIWTGQAIKSEIEYSESTDICSSHGYSAPCAVRHAPPFYLFRGAYIWGPTGAILDNPEYPRGKMCDWKAL